MDPKSKTLPSKHSYGKRKCGTKLIGKKKLSFNNIAKKNENLMKIETKIQIQDEGQINE